MKNRFLAVLAVILFALTVPAIAQQIPVGSLYATNFTNWQVPKGNNAPFSWSNPQACTTNSDGITFRAFYPGTPVLLVDLVNPALTEAITPTAVSITGAGCTLTATPSHSHVSFYLTTSTGGLQEAVNYSRTAPSVVVVTADWTGITSQIASAVGDTNISILDARTSVIVPYIWNSGSSLYVAQPFAGGGAVVKSLNTLVGDLTLAAGSNVTITPSGGNTLTIAATVPAGGVTSASAGTGISVNGGAGPATGVVTIVNTAPLNASGLQSVLAASPFSITNALCTDANGDFTQGLIFIGSADGTPTCGGNLTVDSSGNLWGYNNSGTQEFELSSVDGHGFFFGLVSGFGLDANGEKVSHIQDATMSDDAVAFNQIGSDQIDVVSSPLTLSGRTLAIPPATTSANGYLTSTDWNTFNSKAASGATFTLGSTSIALGSTTTSVAGLTLTGAAVNGTVGATTPSTGVFTSGNFSSFALVGSSATTNFNADSFGHAQIANNTAATSGANHAPAIFDWLGTYWNGSSSQQDQWAITPTYGAGTNPTSRLVFSHTGTSGTSGVDLPAGSTVPASGLTGSALPVGITTASGLTTAAGGAFGTAAFVNTGTSGGTLCLLNTSCTFSGATNSFANIYATKTAVGPVSFTPLYLVDVRDSSVGTQAHYADSNADNGQYFGSNGATNFNMSGGAMLTSSNWVMKATTGSIYSGNLGDHLWYTISGTIGSSATPVNIMHLYASGGLCVSTSCIDPGINTLLTPTLKVNAIVNTGIYTQSGSGSNTFTGATSFAAATGVTRTTGDSSLNLATTAFVQATLNAGLVSPTITGTGTSTFAVGGSGIVGTGATAVCQTSMICDSYSGTVLLTTGTGVLGGGSGAVVVTFPNTRTSQPNCVVGFNNSSGLWPTANWGTTTISLTISVNLPLTSSTVYSFSYICGGK